ADQPPGGPGAWAGPVFRGRSDEGKSPVPNTKGSPKHEMMNDSKLERKVNAVVLSRPARHERGESRREGFSSNGASSPLALSSLSGRRGSVVARWADQRFNPE